MNAYRYLPLEIQLSERIADNTVPRVAQDWPADLRRRSIGLRRGGFTLIELVVMVGMIGLLALVLVPGLAHTGVNVRAVQCLSNLTQMQAGANVYSGDFNDAILPNRPLGPVVLANWINSRSGVNWTTSDENTNPAPCLTGALAPYIQNQFGLYKCPGDTIPSENGPRLRSYSMNGYMGYSGGQQYNPTWKSYTKVTELGGSLPPAKAFIFCEEHMINMNDGYLQVNCSTPGSFPDVPANYHEGGACFSFADGHVEYHRWVYGGGSRPIKSIPYVYGIRYGVAPWNYKNPAGSGSGVDVDWIWFTQHASARL